MHGQETNNPVHGLSQPLLVHTRKRESKERLDLGKNSLNQISHPPKNHDYGRPTFARVSFFKRIQLLDGYADHLELLPRTKEISISVMHGGKTSCPMNLFRISNCAKKDSICQTVQQCPHSIHIS